MSVFLAAANVLLEEGWQQGHYSMYTSAGAEIGPYCVMGAIGKVLDRDPSDDSVMNRIPDIFGPVKPAMQWTRFNDRENATLPEVLTLLCFAHAMEKNP